ncbi:GNAT family N-acetyltransferase [Marinifilum sp. N1E240]|uniref:GNAT family N-acetyltransferase n=1 Tax=Marinifilum sp. N1E240 TaxID=2608082 RepID=UPI00128C12AC|nr:GNAT family N-acetyltransferase [Marinifilum sp. N1E240]MPQ49102.1 GNAT family N-acetyltransferase [Marinifilum sp. N1E240]
MIEIKTFNTFHDFWTYNQSEFLDNYYIYFNFIKILDNTNDSGIQVFDAFNIVDDHDRTIICIWVDSTFFSYSNEWTTEMAIKVNERIDFPKFNNYAFIGQRDLTTSLLSRVNVEATTRKNRHVYTCKKVMPITSEIKGIVENASIEYLDQLVNLGIHYHREEFGLTEKTDQEIESNIISAIQSGILYCLRIDNVIHSILMVISYDRDKPMIGSLYTKPISRSKGYAYKLLHTVTEGLHKSGYNICGLLSNADNPASNRVFLKTGYDSIYDSVFITKEE